MSWLYHIIYFCPYRCLPPYCELFLISETDVSRDKSKTFKSAQMLPHTAHKHVQNTISSFYFWLSNNEAVHLWIMINNAVSYIFCQAWEGEVKHCFEHRFRVERSQKQNISALKEDFFFSPQQNCSLASECKYVLLIANIFDC